MGRHPSVVERTLEDIGWGSYHNKLFFNCSFGWGCALMWLSTISNILTENKDFDEFDKAILGAAINCGAFIGCFVFSSLSDRYGRSYIFKKITIVTCASSIILVVSWNLLTTLIAVIFLGLGIGGDLSTPPSVMIESIPPSYRKRVVLMNMGYCIGPMISQLIALAITLWWDFPIEKWRALAGVVAVITVIISYFRDDVLESPIYLFKHRDTEFISVIVKIAQSNNRLSYEYKAPLLVAQHSRQSIDDFEPKASIKDIFRGQNLRSTVLLSISQFLFYFGFVGCLLSFPQILAKQSMETTYIVLISQQLSGLIGLILASKMVDSCFGRKWTISVGFFFCGIMAFLFIFAENFYISTVFFMLVYIGLLMGIASKNLITPESYKEDLRGAGVGFVMAVSRTGGILVPIWELFINRIFGSEYTTASFGVIFMLAGFISMFLKETKKIKYKLPQTIILA